MPWCPALASVLCRGLTVIVPVLGIKQAERRLLRWRPEYRERV